MRISIVLQYVNICRILYCFMLTISSFVVMHTTVNVHCADFPLQTKTISINKEEFFDRFSKLIDDFNFENIHSEHFINCNDKSSQIANRIQLNYALSFIALLSEAERQIISNNLNHDEKLLLYNLFDKARNKMLSANAIGYGSIILVNALAQSRLALLFNIVANDKQLKNHERDNIIKKISNDKYFSPTTIIQLAIKEMRIDIKDEPMSLYKCATKLSLEDTDYAKLSKNNNNETAIAIYQTIVVHHKSVSPYYRSRFTKCTPMSLVDLIYNTRQFDAYAVITVHICEKLGGKKPKDPSSAKQIFLEGLDEIQKELILSGAKSDIDILKKVGDTYLFIRNGIKTKGKKLASFLVQVLDGGAEAMSQKLLKLD